MRSAFALDQRFGLLARVVLVASVLVVAAAIYAPSAHAADFNPNYVLSDAQLRDYRSMNQADIQAFLETKPGILKEYRARDHTGKSKAASQIIYDACVAWKINPRVMLALLQKENSLISNPDPTARALERAVGAGCPNSVENRYPGFGPQVWNGARMLDGYGEGKTTSYIPKWHKGTKYEASNIVLTRQQPFSRPRPLSCSESRATRESPSWSPAEPPTSRRTTTCIRSRVKAATSRSSPSRPRSPSWYPYREYTPCRYYR